MNKYYIGIDPGANGAAQRLYPNHKKITHANADAIMIARYCYEVSK